MKLFGQLPLEDLEHLGNITSELIRENRNTNFVIIGASGFIGRWLTTYFTYLQMNAEFLGTLSLVVRNSKSLSEIQEKSLSGHLKIIEANGLNSTSFLHLNSNRIVVFFAASSTSMAKVENLDAISPSLELAKTVVHHLPKGELSFIHLSSGGIYDPEARKLLGIPRNYKTQLQSNNSYISEKISLEKWSTEQLLTSQFSALNPRLFSFYGPGLQLDRHFAIGEFIKRARRNLALEVIGNPANRRTYLHPRDAILQLLFQCRVGVPLHTQIGSANPITIQETANLIAKLNGVEVRILGSEENEIDHYVPLDVPITREKDFEQGLEQWCNWLSHGLIN